MVRTRDGCLGTEPFVPASRSQGPQGHQDGADPSQPSRAAGDSPGPAGHNDAAAAIAGGQTSALPTTSTWRVHLAWNSGKPVIYEYGRDGHLCNTSELSYGKHLKRSWYEEGDIILHESLIEKALTERYPELAAKGPSGSSALFDLAWGFLMAGPPTKYKLAHKILSIAPGSNGNGDVVLGALLILDEEGEAASVSFIELEKRLELSRYWLNDSWLISEVVRGWSWIETMANLYLEVAMNAAGGMVSGAARGVVVRSAGRWVARFTVRQAVRRAALKAMGKQLTRRLARESFTTVSKASLAYAKAFAKEVTSGLKNRPLPEVARLANLDTEDFRGKLAQTAHMAAMGAFVTAVIEETLGEGLKVAVFAGVDKGKLTSILGREILLRITKPLTVGQLTLFVTAISAAAATSMNSPGRFEQQLGDALVAEMKSMAGEMLDVSINWGDLLEKVLAE